MEEHVIEMAGSQLRVQRRGDPIAEPFLFLHGGLGTLKDFDPFFPRMDDRNCILLDSRGHGGSTLSGSLSYERLALDAEAVIQHLDLRQPTIVGFSDGGIAAVRIAAARRIEIARLILFGTDPDRPPPEVVEGIFANLTPETWRAKFPEGTALYERLNPDPNFGRLFEAVLAMWQDQSADGYPGSLVENVRCPTLVIGGDRDHLVSRSATFELAQRIEKAELAIIPFGGHAIFQEQTDIILQFMNAFLRYES